MKKRVYLSVLVLFLMIALAVGFMGAASARATTSRHKFVTTVTVSAGDSLWSIAKEYYSDDCGSMEDYIYEIKRSNHLYDDKITLGQAIIVPYYR